MKKIALSIISFFVLGFGVNAQDFEDTTYSESSSTLVNKKGQAILPEAGDIAIGMDMVPFMDYIGRFGSASNSYDGNNFLSKPTTVFLKYFLDESTAVRLFFQAEAYNYSQNVYVQDDAEVFANPLNYGAKTTDQKLSKSSAYTIGLGYEKHRNKGRLVGVFGGQALFSISNSKNEYSYGNPFSEINQNPTSYDFNTYNAVRQISRIKSSDNGSSISLGLDGFIGVEYFIMPNIAIGSELSWGLSFGKGKQQSKVTEYWNGGSVQEYTELTSPGNKSFSIGMSNPSVSLYIMFHF